MAQEDLRQRIYTEGTLARWSIRLAAAANFCFSLSGLLGSIPDAQQIEITCKTPTVPQGATFPDFAESFCGGIVGATEGRAGIPWKIILPFLAGAVLLYAATTCERFYRDRQAEQEARRARVQSRFFMGSEK